MSDDDLLHMLRALAERGLRPCRNLQHIIASTGPCKPCEQKRRSRINRARYLRVDREQRRERSVGW